MVLITVVVCGWSPGGVVTITIVVRSTDLDEEECIEKVGCGSNTTREDEASELDETGDIIEELGVALTEGLKEIDTLLDGKIDDVENPELPGFSF